MATDFIIEHRTGPRYLVHSGAAEWMMMCPASIVVEGERKCRAGWRAGAFKQSRLGSRVQLVVQPSRASN